MIKGKGLQKPRAEFKAKPLHALGQLCRRQRALLAAVHCCEAVGDSQALTGKREADPCRDGAAVQQPQLAGLG